MMIGIPVLLHLFLFPALVWLISKLFYYHTFRYMQTLRFALPEHLNKLLLIYSIPFLIYRYYYSRKKTKKEAAIVSLTVPPVIEQPPSFIISEGNRQRLIPASDILYFTASPPYVHIHLYNKKHLVSLTLKSVLERTGGKPFIRIHKSTIVNVKEVVSLTSRHNGDYDLVMKNDAQLRLSRNYAAAFKEAFQQLAVV